MVSFGRCVCVALPFLLTAASLIALLVAGLAGVSGNKNGLYMFRINLTDLQVEPSTLAGLVGRSPHPQDVSSFLGSKATDVAGQATDIAGQAEQLAKDLANGGSDKAKELAATIQKMASDSGKSVEEIAKEVAAKTGGSADDLLAKVKAVTGNAAASGNGNVTAADIGLNKIYDVNLWGFCYEPQVGERTCLEPKFDWARDEINKTMTTIRTLSASLNTISGRNITIPKEVTDGLDVFSQVVRWTEIVFIIATIALGVALILGIAANFSRAVSCLTWVVQGVATAAVLAFASLATATAVVVVGLVESTAKIYGASSNFNNGYLAAVWISAAFSIAAGIFWLATVCCCKPEQRDRSSKRHSDVEKLVGSNNSSSYAPIQGSGYYNNTTYGAPRQNVQPSRPDMAYEPYSHAR